ncbi:MAG: SDR family oxidoreductase [Rhodobacteraceae bacterium]|nr:SDR family oxidoreductase [Paracoccaceae bacterium]
MEHAQKTALVTGASRGLGYATALTLADKGYHIIALARTVGGLEELADVIEPKGHGITLVPLDITDEGGLQRLCLSIFERWKGLDLLVHCAVQAPLLTPMDGLIDKDYDKTMNVNARATARIITLTEPLLRVADGTAIFMDDKHDGEKFFASYAASKAAARSMVLSYQAETANLKPRVILHEPAPMPTATRARFHPGEDKSALASPADEAKRMIEMYL